MRARSRQALSPCWTFVRVGDISPLGKQFGIDVVGRFENALYVSDADGLLELASFFVTAVATLFHVGSDSCEKRIYLDECTCCASRVA